jgi:hypothetical protein
MHKLMCKVCGKLHTSYRKACECHPAIIRVWVDDLPDTERRLTTREAEQAQACPVCAGTGSYPPMDTTDYSQCYRCHGTGQA